MSDEDFELLLESAQQAKDFIKGKKVDGIKVHIPYEIDVKRIRGNLSMTQKEFAATFGFSKRTIEDWEQGRRMPEKSARMLLKLIDRQPAMVLETLRAA